MDALHHVWPDRFWPGRARSGTARRAIPLEIAALERPRHPGLRDLVDEWAGRQGALAPAEVLGADAAELPRLVLLEPIEDGRDWRFRMVGAGLIRRLGFDPTGGRLCQVHDDQGGGRLARRYRAVAANGALAITRIAHRLESGETLIAEEVARAVAPAAGLPWIAAIRRHADDGAAAMEKRRERGCD